MRFGILGSSCTTFERNWPTVTFTPCDALFPRIEERSSRAEYGMRNTEHGRASRSRLRTRLRRGHTLRLCVSLELGRAEAKAAARAGSRACLNPVRLENVNRTNLQAGTRNGHAEAWSLRPLTSSFQLCRFGVTRFPKYKQLHKQKSAQGCAGDRTKLGN